MEIWKDVPEYVGLYKVSNYGNIKRNDKILSSSGKRYNKVTLFKNRIRKSINVHRLVALAFIPNPDNKPCVDHIDGNSFNNNVSNLRWVTPKENSNNPITLNNIKLNCTANQRYSYKSPVAKCIIRISSKGDIKEYGSIMDAKRDGFCYNSILLCLKGKMRKHKNYNWKYKNV